jgi:uncharacterized protein with HEPN domain
VPSRDWRLRLQDILQSITGIEQRIANITFEEFQSKETIVKAVLYDFVVIGEATRTIPDEIQNLYPDIPWRLMAGMLNVVTHEYFQIDLARIWETIQDDLPRLISPSPRSPLPGVGEGLGVRGSA